jgi:hypothetical protein
MKANKLALKINGYVSIFAAICHIIWTFYFSGYQEFKSLNKAQWDVILIFNWSTALMLFLFGTLSLFISKLKMLSDKQIQIFCYLFLILWTGRFIIDLIYPVPIPFLFMGNAGILVRLILLFCMINLLSNTIITFYTSIIGQKTK